MSYALWKRDCDMAAGFGAADEKIVCFEGDER
jgi:hypothetical protein